MNELSDYVIQPQALTLIERFLATCIEVNVPIETIRFEREKPITLLDLFARAPIVSLDLHSICLTREIKEVSPREVIDHFAGPSHMHTVRKKTRDSDYIVQATGQRMSVRMKEVGMHWELPQNKAIFELFDLALPARVISTSDRLAIVVLLGKVIRNYVISKNIVVNKDDWVLCHKGAIIIALSEDELSRVHHLIDKSEYVKKLLEITPNQMNCRNFCPSDINKKDGGNLTAWNLNRL